AWTPAFAGDQLPVRTGQSPIRSGVTEKQNHAAFKPRHHRRHSADAGDALARARRAAYLGSSKPKPKVTIMDFPAKLSPECFALQDVPHARDHPFESSLYHP
ncbi:MAG TPA: hypothetical protein PKC77_16775, partial [Sphingopyxis sp.]|nr:hypothetical protein [Sphingopyxis sp.]